MISMYTSMLHEHVWMLNTHMIDHLIEICQYFSDKIKDLVFFGMYVEYMVLFDCKTYQIQGLYCPFLHTDYARIESYLNKTRSL